MNPADPAVVLTALLTGLEATEAAIIRLHALREAQLAVAQDVAVAIAASERSGSTPGAAAELAARSVAAEIAGVLRMSDRVVQGRMARAADLVARFPATMRAFTDARINAAHVRTIHDAGARLDETVRAEFEQIAVAASEGETPHRAKRIVERVAERLAPRSLTERHRDVQEHRRVWREDLGDGQKALGLIHSAAIVDGIYDRLTQQARAVAVANSQAAKEAFESSDPGSLGDPNDARTMDQLRADLCADTLLTGAASGHDTPSGLLTAIQARVEVTVPVLTLVAADAGSGTGSGTPFGARTEQPAELAGGQPIDTHTARTLAGGATAWERVLTHPVTGAILAVDHYRPNTDLRRLLHARDSRCRFPTCGLPPAAQDLDHTIDAAYGGSTEEGNLGGLCRRHHVLKHQTAWKVKQRGAGILEWTSPVGRTYIDRPPPPVTFTVEDPDPPPGSGIAPAPF
ncbi:HNH endonuclease [Microbacterium sp. MYb64]|nr:HNH endonuclease [Microbacterium sp. MYb64]